jgi:acetyl esterase/lipase
MPRAPSATRTGITIKRAPTGAQHAQDFRFSIVASRLPQRECAEPSLKLLLGDLPDQVPELAQLASPVYHVDANDPPLLLLHGDRDPQMPINQSLQLLGAYEALGLDVDFIPVHGAAHGGPLFNEPKYTQPAIAFAQRTIGK